MVAIFHIIEWSCGGFLFGYLIGALIGLLLR
jgi:hypothetical protein